MRFGCCCKSKNNAGGFVAIMGGAVVTAGVISADDHKESTVTASPYVLSHDADRIDGTPQPLDEFAGSVILVVNTASKCGLTPQYEGLESLYLENEDAGFVVLGFPANNFMGQEPGTNEEIAQFCAEKFDVTFPMFAKVEVKGKQTHPLFAHLADLSEAPSWNFTKYLIDREGKFVERFGPRTGPEDKKLVAKIDELLAAPVPASETGE